MWTDGQTTDGRTDAGSLGKLSYKLNGEPSAPVS